MLCDHIAASGEVVELVPVVTAAVVEVVEVLAVVYLVVAIVRHKNSSAGSAACTCLALNMARGILSCCTTSLAEQCCKLSSTAFV